MQQGFPLRKGEEFGSGRFYLPLEMCLFIKKAFKLVSLVIQYKNRIVLSFPKVRQIPYILLREISFKQPCKSTYLTIGEMGSVLPICRDRNFGSPSCPLSPSQCWKESREACSLDKDEWWPSSGFPRELQKTAVELRVSVWEPWGLGGSRIDRGTNATQPSTGASLTTAKKKLP